MELLHFVVNHHTVLAYLLLIGSLFLTATEIRHLVKSQKVSNHLNLTRDHRQIWSEFFRTPQLERILDAEPDLKLHPVTTMERLFVTFLILHLHAVFKAKEEHMFDELPGLRVDLSNFLSLPIPRQVWEMVKGIQEPLFAAFVEQCLEKR